MTICIVHYGCKASLELLELWFKKYRESGCKLDVVIITDGVPKIPDAYDRYAVEDMSNYQSVIRPKMIFDVKGALMLAAIRKYGDCFFVDSDAFFLKDPTQQLKLLRPETLIAMGTDAYPRVVAGSHNSCIMRNAGVLVVQAKEESKKNIVNGLYRLCFAKLQKADGANILLEQNAWSYVHSVLMEKNLAECYSNYLNWSRLWDPNDPNIIVLHEHGPQKWDKYKISKPT